MPTALASARLVPCLTAATLLATLACGSAGTDPTNPDAGGDARSGASADGPGGPAMDGSTANVGPGLFVPVEGSRLKARWLEAGGQRSFPGWYDSQLKTECSFATAADGEVRCLPLGYSLGTSPTEWADPACTIPAVVVTRPSCEPRMFVRRIDTSNPCQVRERVYRLGARITQASTYWRPESACEPGGHLADAAVFRVGEELPVSMFVKASKVTAPAVGANDPVRLVLIEAEDGAKESWGWQHVGANADCALWTLADGKLHCVPSPAPVSSVTFSDQACMQGAAFFTPACGPAPAFVRRPTPNACPETSTVSAIGPRLETVNRAQNGACTPAQPPAGTQYHTVGAEVSPGMFPVFEFMNTGADGLQRRSLIAPGGRAIGSNWFDANRQEACFPTQIGDRQRCAPSTTLFGFDYADAQCTRPVYKRARNGCPSKYVRVFDFDVCPPSATIHAVGSEHTGPTWRRITLRAEASARLDCRSTPPAADTVYHTLTPIPGDQFPELKAIEPPR